MVSRTAAGAGGEYRARQGVRVGGGHGGAQYHAHAAHGRAALRHRLHLHVHGGGTVARKRNALTIAERRAVFARPSCASEAAGKGKGGVVLLRACDATGPGQREGGASPTATALLAVAQMIPACLCFAGGRGGAPGS